jgi:adenylate cyclase class 2
MNPTGIEIETKFFVNDLKKIETRLLELEARLFHERVHELNLRFDLPDGSLGATYRVLRLRKDEQAILTFKGAGKESNGIRSREEWEVVVSDFATMQKILESLGYIIQFSYEKFRATYSLEGNLVMLDEMPYGNFIEIEGDDQTSIFSIADQLHLKKTAAISESYQVLFEHVKTSLGLSFRDILFDNFAGIQVEPFDLGVLPAD